MSNSSLVNYTKISPNSNNPRNATIKKITIHHMAGNLSVETCGNVFSGNGRQASSNYGIGSDGRVGMYVEEKNRSWCSSNSNNDHQAITIEVANDGGASTNWHVSDKALAKLIDLCVDICKRNGIKELVYDGTSKGNLTRHNMFAATTCPGPYLQSKFPYITSEVNKRLGSQPAPEPKPQPTETTYKVVKGDCLSSIGKKFNVKWQDIASLNNIPGPKYIIYVGQVLRIPGSTPQPAPTPSSSFNVGDTVIVNGIGKSSSDGKGGSTKNYSNHKAKIIRINNGASYPYALNCNNNMNGVTGWFASSSIKK